MLVPDPEQPGDERATVLDFGIAKLLALPADAEGGAAVQRPVPEVLTEAHVRMGSPLYMAPEQWQGVAQVTDKSDVYALGIIAYELFTGARPFPATDPLLLMKQHLFDPPPPLRTRDPALPAALAVLVESMLVKPPAERPTMAAVAAQLGPLVGLERTARASTGPAAVRTESHLSPQPQAAPASPPQTAPPTAAERALPVLAAASPRSRSLLRVGALGLLVGAGLGATTTYVITKRAAEPMTSAAAPPLSPSRALWSRVESGTEENLYAIWGSGPRDVFAVGGGGQVLRYDGSTWSRSTLKARAQNPDALRAIWGSGPGDIYAVGKGGVIFH